MKYNIRKKNIRIILAGGFIACSAVACAHSKNNEFTYRLPEAPAGYHHSRVSGAGAEALSWFDSCDDNVLREYMEKMLANNPTILQMAAAVERSKAAYGIVYSETYPNINLNASVGTIRRPEDAQTHHYYLSLPVTYELDVWKKLKARKQATFLEVQATEQDKQALTITMVSELMERYYEGLFLLQQQRLLDTIVELGRRKYELETKRYAEGVIAKENVYLSRRQLDEYIALQLQNHADLSRVEHALKILMGELPCDEWLEGEFAVPGYLSDIPPGLPSELLRRRPDLSAIVLRLEALKLKVWEANRDKFFPSISLTAAGEGRAEELHALLSGESMFWSIFAHFSSVLFDFNRRQFEIKAEKAKGEELLQVYKQTLLRALGEVEDSLVLCSECSSIRMNAIDKENVLNEAFVLRLQRYENGMDSLLEKLEAEQSFILGKKERYRAELSLIAVRIQLMRVLGGAWWPDRQRKATGSSGAT